MKPARKIPSFTLTEMLVVLVISTIVVGLAYSVLSLFTKNLIHINENYQGTNEIQLLELQMALDFQRYHEISLNERNKELTLKTPLDSIIYRFDSEKIIRLKDTLLTSKIRLEGYYLGKRQKTGVIDALKIELNNSGLEYLFISKENDAWHLMKHGH